MIRGIPALHPAARGYASDALSPPRPRPRCALPCVALWLFACVAATVPACSAAQHPASPARCASSKRPPPMRCAFHFYGACFRTPSSFTSSATPREPQQLGGGWRERRFLAYGDLPGWPHRGWSFLLPLTGRPWSVARSSGSSLPSIPPPTSPSRRDLADLPPRASPLSSLRSFWPRRGCRAAPPC